MPSTFEATATFSPAHSGGALHWPTWMQRLARPFRVIPAAALDQSTGVYNRSGLFAAAEEAVRVRPEGTPVSVVVVECSDLRELYQVYGKTISRKVAGRVVRRLRMMAGLDGLVGRTGPTEFTVVMPGATEDKAIRNLQRVLGKPARVEFDAGDSEIVLVPDLLVDSVDTGCETVQARQRAMSRELARILRNERRRLDFLTSERERHSQPMTLPPRR